jgi:hypothetical protein
MLKVVSANQRIPIPPIIAKGRVHKITKGCKSDSKSAAITMSAFHLQLCARVCYTLAVVRFRIPSLLFTPDKTFSI